MKPLELDLHGRRHEDSREFHHLVMAQTPAKTWIKDHMASQDGSAMIATLHTHFVGPSQVECIVQYA